ncbi:MAG TPA: 30S ribosomal protein S19e, partial [Candidatus Nanoarchaeia archaeon]|nr:30S ribosomal protein S19e [Candidatus Nanoarchaeia archaeon]
MGSSYDVNANALIESVAKQLQGETHLKPPTWAAFAKTGAHKDRPPARQDWWYVRAASVLRTINRMGPIGVAKLRTKYGGERNRGHQPDEPRLGSGNILRKILQQLEKAQYIAPVTKGIHKGRIIAPKGRSLLDKTAAGL